MTTSRSSVAIPDTWDLTPLYPSIESWENDFNSVNFESLSPLRGTVKHGPKAIKKIFDVYFTLDRHIRKLYTWAHLSSDVEMIVENTRSAYSRIQSLCHFFAETASWIEPEILSLSDEEIQTAIASEDLLEYRIHLQKLVRLKPHTLSEREEQILH